MILILLAYIMIVKFLTHSVLHLCTYLTQSVLYFCQILIVYMLRATQLKGIILPNCRVCRPYTFVYCV